MTDFLKKDLQKKSRDQLASDLINEVPGLSTIVSSVQHWRHTMQVNALQRFLSAAEINDDYLSRLAADPTKQEIFYEYAQAASKTRNTIACLCLALIFRDDEIDMQEKIIHANALNGIGTDTTDFLQNPIIKETFDNAEGTANIDLEKLIPTELRAISTTRDLVNRNICAGSNIIGDIGMHVRVTGYTVFIHERLLMARAYLPVEE